MNNGIKRQIINENIYINKYGLFKNLLVLPSIKTSYMENNVVNPSTNFSDVYVKNIHSIAIAKECVSSGMNPVIVTTVNNEFDGSNIDLSSNIHDEIINMRTNYHRTVDKSIYPIKESEVVYAPYVTVIRDETFKFQNLFRIATITSCPISNPPLINNSMKLKDYIATRRIIETIFQTAQYGNHDVIIFSDFGSKITKTPLSNLVDIFNNLILSKYGYVFKMIIFAIPIRDTIDMASYTYFLKEIIKPQDLENNITITKVQQNNNQIFNQSQLNL